MKKTLSVIAVAVAMVFGFSSCEDDLGLLGNITLTTSNAVGEQAYSADQQFDFHSAICNAHLSDVHIQIDSLGIDTTLNGELGAMFVGLTDNLLSASDFDNITFPLVGINLRDTVAGTYNFTYNIDWSFIEQIDTTSLNKMITSGLSVSNNLGNLFVVAASENSFYVAITGNINVSEFGGNGSLVKGTMNNLFCIYVTRDHLETLRLMPPSQRENINLLTEFPTIVFNGNMESRRASIETVMQALESLDD
ncbi:MAG: hypothetical protein IKR83_06975 [Bacteroidales bacterium]|nr:hypothetical protein [Bacteroidales bacterium]